MSEAKKQIEVAFNTKDRAKIKANGTVGVVQTISVGRTGRVQYNVEYVNTQQQICGVWCDADELEAAPAE